MWSRLMQRSSIKWFIWINQKSILSWNGESRGKWKWNCLENTCGRYSTFWRISQKTVFTEVYNREKKTESWELSIFCSDGTESGSSALAILKTKSALAESTSTHGIRITQSKACPSKKQRNNRNWLFFCRRFTREHVVVKFCQMVQWPETTVATCFELILSISPTSFSIETTRLTRTDPPSFHLTPCFFFFLLCYN